MALHETKPLTDPNFEEADLVLATRARQGDREAFSRLYEKYVREIGAYIFRIVHSPEVAEELTQDAFLKAWIALPGLKEIVFRPLLYKIARNAAIDHLRREDVRRHHGLGTPG